MSVARRCSTAILPALFVCLVGTVASEANLADAYGRLPLSFEANHGQTHSSIEFVARSTGYQLFLTAGDAVLVLRRPGKAGADTLRMSLVGADPARLIGVDQLPGAVSYLIGSDPARWRTAIPTYAKVLARGVYPGVDLVYYGNGRQLEYDFVLAPGADPASIRLSLRGLEATDWPALSLDASGDLTLRAPGGDVRLKRPIAYQTDDEGNRQQIDVAYVIVGPLAATGDSTWNLGFVLGAYDPSRALVIDPVLSYSTYLGGSELDGGMAVAVRNGEAYVTGYTDSLNFPAAGGPNQPGRDAFVAKLNSTGSALLYATYLGGSADDAGMGIAVDSSGDAYVTGFTDSTDFPTAPATPLLANQGGRDAFVARLDGAGTLVYSTYLGGGADDAGLGIAVDVGGSAYVTGWTDSSDFPTTISAFQGDQDVRDAFVAKLSAAGTALVYSTYLGGDGADEGHAIAVDASGLAYVTGHTASTNFPTSANTRTRSTGQEAFVGKLDPGASGAASRLFLTYFGGTGADAGFGIAVDSTGLVYVTGSTTSANLPTKSTAFQLIHGGGQDAFVSKFNPAGSGANAQLMYSTFLGGSGDDVGHAIAVDEEGQAYVAGFTTSGNFPTRDALDAALGGSKDAFVAKLDPAESGSASLGYSTLLGGGGDDEAYGIAVDAAGSAYVVGLTRSADFPVVGSTATLGGVEDAFVVKLGQPDLVVSVLTVPATAGEGAVITVTDVTRNNGAVAAGASTTSFYLSTDNKLEASDPFLGSRAVPALDPGQENTIDTPLTLPSTLPPATYFLFAKADGDDVIGESLESNNKTKKTIVIGTDLTVSSIFVTSSGLTMTVTDTTRNAGGAAAAASTTKFFFSGPTGEVLLGSRSVASLAAGAESTASTDFPIPSGTPPAATPSSPARMPTAS